VRVARDAIDDARAMCAREYGGAPAVDVYGDPDFT
jgi:pyruvate dehydrogenase kinase 2/3/4